MRSAAYIFRRTKCLKFLILFLLCLLSRLHSTLSNELLILQNLQAAFNKSNTDVFDSWKSSNSPCTFTGIFCNSDNSVTQIDLPQKGLFGTLPLASICELESLERLNLSSNFLYGTISEDLKNCTKLQYLDLSANSLAGTVPIFSSLSRLEDLRLNDNRFSGLFPSKSLENLTNLVSLRLGDNPFNRSPFPLEVLKSNKLTWLYLSNCSLEGRIPAGIGNLTELINLELSQNHIFGEIPETIGKLQKLWQFELYENHLTGKLPVGFGNLTNLEKFDASTNSLEGDLSELKSLTQLVSLQLFENQFSGEIPDEFGDFKYLLNLSLYNNKLTGLLPQKLGSLSDFNFIDVSENFLTGPIPPNMCQKGKMTEMLILQNKFTGSIPENYANCSSLIRLRLSNNSLSGVIPSGIWGLRNLNFIDLAMNEFVGPVTSDIGNANSLAQLRISSNRFSEELPAEISKASALVLIDVSFNQFSGKIPARIGELKKLNSLYLQENMFSGAIPNSLGSCTSLNNINFAGNTLSGQIPTTLGSLASLNSLNLSRNQLSGQIPASLSYVKLSLLDLSNNRLTGPIPQSLLMASNDGSSFAGNPGLCSPNIGYLRPCSSDSGKPFQFRTLVYCLLTGATVLLVSLACFIFIWKRQRNQNCQLKADSWNLKSFRKLSFTEQEILNSIKQENLIGKGGSGNVYKVVLDNGKELAVKHIWNSDSGSGRSSHSSMAMLNKRPEIMPEFEAEVATLSSIRHVNVVKLYCSITSEDSSLLVYEYLPSGSLWDQLHTSRCIMELNWERRYDIAVGAAKGLEYLHHGCERPVVHRDVKSSNILLDNFFKPRIADFGLAKIVKDNGGNETTHIVAGTHGYIAPEYAYTTKVNEKSDVYSFGVVLMELVTGKRPIEAEFGENKDIVNWVCSRMGSKESIVGVVDSSIPDTFKEDALKVLRIAVLCTARLPALRPSMRNVVQMLEVIEH